MPTAPGIYLREVIGKETLILIILNHFNHHNFSLSRRIRLNQLKCDLMGLIEINRGNFSLYSHNNHSKSVLSNAGEVAERSW